MSDFDRCLYYWIRNNEMGLKSLKKIKSKSFKIINYDKFFNESKNTLQEISFFLNIKKTNQTNLYLNKILNRRTKIKKIKFDSNLIKKAQKLEDSFNQK